MKVRNGFVSNSSSSSFVIKKEDLSDLQIYLIKNHLEVGKILDKHIDFYSDDFEGDYKPEPFVYFGFDDRWKIEESDLAIGGSTWMDNFCMERFMRLIGVDRDKVNFVEV